MELGGPALIESENTTVLVPPGAVAEVDGFGNMAIQTGEMG